MGWAQTRTRISIWCVPPHCHEFTSSKCLSYHTLTHIFVLLNEMKWNEYGKQPTQVHSIHWWAWIRTSSLFDFNDDMSLSIQYTLFWYERQQLKSMTRPTDLLTDWLNGTEWIEMNESNLQYVWETTMLHNRMCICVWKIIFSAFKHTKWTMTLHMSTGTKTSQKIVFSFKNKFLLESKFQWAEHEERNKERKVEKKIIQLKSEANKWIVISMICFQLTGILNMSSIRDSGDFPFFGRTNTKICLSSEQLYNNFSIKTCREWSERETKNKNKTKFSKIY